MVSESFIVLSHYRFCSPSIHVMQWYQYKSNESKILDSIYYAVNNVHHFFQILKRFCIHKVMIIESFVVVTYYWFTIAKIHIMQWYHCKPLNLKYGIQSEKIIML